MVYGLTSQCFTGETLVSTETGLCPIEEIQKGDYVWSENTKTGEKELKKVLSVSITETATLIHVITENGTEINTTENHPFYVEGKGWVAAAELESGDMLRTQEGKTETVAQIETENLEEAVKVYNLEIEDNHTYYVSEDEVLVHNECGGADIPGESGSASNYGIDMDNLNFSNTVQNHTGRPYQDSKLLINEIIESKPPVPDPRGTNALSWTVEGTFNGSTGYYELIIDSTSNTVWHFVFKSQ